MLMSDSCFLGQSCPLFEITGHRFARFVLALGATPRGRLAVVARACFPRLESSAWVLPSLALLRLETLGQSLGIVVILGVVCQVAVDPRILGLPSRVAGAPVVGEAAGYRDTLSGL